MIEATQEAAAADLVVKVGGSLMRVDAATRIVKTLASAASDRRILTVSGGGAEADQVRERFRRGELDLVDAHWEAIRSLDRMGARLAARYEAGGGDHALRLCASADECRAAWTEGELALIVPFPLFDELDPLPHRWDVTSDSVAAWLAEHFDASELVLVKARAPRSAGVDTGGAAAGGTDADTGDGGASARTPEVSERAASDRESSAGSGSCAGVLAARAAAEEELVDPYFPTAMGRRGFRARCWIANGRQPETLAAWLETGSTAGLWRMEPPDAAEDGRREGAEESRG